MLAILCLLNRLLTVHLVNLVSQEAILVYLHLEYLPESQALFLKASQIAFPLFFLQHALILAKFFNLRCLQSDLDLKLPVLLFELCYQKGFCKQFLDEFRSFGEAYFLD